MQRRPTCLVFLQWILDEDGISTDFHVKEMLVIGRIRFNVFLFILVVAVRIEERSELLPILKLRCLFRMKVINAIHSWERYS